MSKDSSNCSDDNIEMFNKLTHSDNGKVDKAVFNKLIEEFEYYILFKKMYNNKMSVKKARPDKEIIKFRVEFADNEVTKTFIKKNKDTSVSFKKKKYLPVIEKIGEHIIDIHFIKG